MRFRLTLESNGQQEVPVNYQHLVSSWIYRVFGQADKEFSSWLHKRGYVFEGKRRYKLFTFSHLYIPNVQLDKERQLLQVKSRHCFLTLSFRMEQAAEKFVTGLFRNQHLYLGNSLKRGDFDVVNVESLSEPTLSETADIRCLSPVCVTKPQEKNGKLSARYLSPEDSGFSEAFFNNLINRYVTESQSNGNGYNIPQFDGQEWSIKPLATPKSKLIRIKKGTPQETAVRGYIFPFRIQAPAELIRFGYEAGFGEKNSLGFGCGEVQEKKDLNSNKMNQA